MVLIKYSGKYVKIYFNMKITCSENYLLIKILFIFHMIRTQLTQ